MPSFPVYTLHLTYVLPPMMAKKATSTATSYSLLLSAISYGTYGLYKGIRTTIVTMGLHIYTKLYTRNIGSIAVTLHPKTLRRYLGNT
jgi:hypothetical protein